MPISQIAPFGANPKAVAWAKRHAAKLIQDISNTTRKNIRDIVTTSIREGRDVRETADLIFDEIEDQARSRVIARTEVMRAANEGQKLLWEEAVDEGLISEDAERIWLFAELPQKNGELCPICASMADQRARFDEVFTDLDGEEYDQPPAHPNCILPGAEISGRVVGGLRAYYDGPAREIQTAQGNRLRLTVNHPVLTTQGWFPSLQLRPGMYVLSQQAQVNRGKLFAAHDSANNYQRPALIQDIFQSLLSHRLTSIQPSRLDLHGDARWVKGQVDVVYPNWKKRLNAKTLCAKHRREFNLELTTVLQASKVGVSTLQFSRDRINLASAFSPSGTTLTDDRLGILLESLPFYGLLFGLASQWDLELTEAARDDATRNASFILELQKRSAGLITLDKIVNVRDFNFSGHVYDLESDVGWIISQNIIISNCRCSLGLAPQSLPKAAAFNPNQERDEHGRWVGEGGADLPGPVKEAVKTISLYHGTADDALASIKEKGLIPHGSPGSDDWAMKQDTLRFLMMSVNNRPASVFLARHAYEAVQFGRYASSVRNGEPVVLEVQVPESFMRQKMTRDEHFSEAGLRTEEHIPPSWIKRVGKLNEDEDDFNWRALASKNTFYLVLVCDPKPRTAEFREDQPRDDHGRWTDAPGTTEDLTQELSRAEINKTHQSMFDHFVKETGLTVHPAQTKLGDLDMGQRGQMKAAIVNKLGAKLDQRLKDTPANFHEDVTLPEGMRERMEQWEQEAREAGHPVHEPGSVMVQTALDKWADTSGDHDATAVQYQLAVQEVFNIDPESRSVYPELKDEIKPYPSMREYVKAEYDNTQEFFKQQGITHVTLYRGFLDRDLDLKNGPTDLLLQPASSWTTDHMIARSFSESYGSRHEHSVILTARVPVERILSTAVTGRGCLSEAEVLVLGGHLKANAFKKGAGTVLDWFRRIEKSVKK